jgi:ArsR family transcriptional regulator
VDSRTRRLNERKAQVIRAVAHPIRLAIIEVLREGSRCVCEIAEAVGAERSNVSRHLSVMVRSGILAGRREGLMVHYELRTPCVVNFLGCVEGVLLEHLAADRRLLRRL